MKVFLSASAGDTARFVSATIRNSGLEVIDTFSVEPGQAFESGLRDRIASADVFVVLLRAPAESQMFEMGIASALGRPIAAVADPTFSLPPAVRADFFIQSPFSDERLLRSFIDTVARKVSQGIGVEDSLPIARIERPRLERLLERTRGLRTTSSGHSLELLVVDLLTSTGLSTASTIEVNMAASDRGADAIVHSPAIAPFLGSPLLVEVKAARLGARRFEEVVSQMVRRLSAYGCQSGVLLYLDERRTRFPILPHPKILAIDVEDLLTEMLDAPFEKALVILRNKAIHGA